MAPEEWDLRDQMGQLDRFWDALAAGAAGNADLDPALELTVRRLHALHRPPRIDPAFQQRLAAQLLTDPGHGSAASWTRPLRTAEVARSVPPNGHAAAPLPRRRLPLAPPVAPAWPLPWLAAAAVLLLAIVGGLALLRGVAERPTVLTAPEEPTVETLVDTTVDSAVDAWVPLAVERWTFQPGPATLTIPVLDGPQWIVAEHGALVATVGDAEHDLSPGAGLIVRAGQALALRNAGSSPASALRGVATVRFSLEQYDRRAITMQVALDTQAHEALPPGTSRIVLERLTLQPGATLKVEPATGQDWVGVSAGRLGLTLVGDALPGDWRSGREREFGAADALPALVPGTQVTLRDVGEEPLVLLRLRVLPLAASAQT